MTNATTIVAAAATTNAAETIAVVSKSSKANAIFKEAYGMAQVPARKDIIARCVKEAGLTEKGAATYLQNYKAKNGLVKKAAAPVAEAAAEAATA